MPEFTELASVYGLDGAAEAALRYKSIKVLC